MHSWRIRPFAGLALAGLAAACARTQQVTSGGEVAPESEARAATTLAGPPKRDSIRQKIGKDTIVVVYTKVPAAGQKVFGGIVPFDTVWRTSLDTPPTLRTTAPLQIGGVQVPAGTYTLYTLPRSLNGARRCELTIGALKVDFSSELASPWQLIFNKQAGEGATEYNPAEDAARVPMYACLLADPEETLQFRFLRSGASTYQLAMSWETAQTWIDFRLAR